MTSVKNLGTGQRWEVSLHHSPLLPQCAALMHQPPPTPMPLVTLKSDRGRVLGMSFTYTCSHFHSHAPYEPPLAASDLSGLVHGRFKERALSGVAVLADTSLGRATHTALNEPASLLGTKHLLPLDQSRRKI